MAVPPPVLLAERPSSSRESRPSVAEAATSAPLWPTARLGNIRRLADRQRASSFAGVEGSQQAVLL